MTTEMKDDQARIAKFTTLWNTLQYNECFAGISGHGHGMADVTCGLNIASTDDTCSATKPTCVARVDNCEFSIAEMALLEDDACQFENINEFFIPPVRKQLPSLAKHPSKILESLMPVTLAGKAMTDTAYCRTHDDHCRFKPTPFSIGSTVCTAESTMNCSRPGTADPSSISTIAFGGLMRATRPTAILHECVKGRKQFIMHLLGDLYWCEDSEIDTHDYGWPFHKNREWLCLLDRGTCPRMTRPLSDFLVGQYRICEWPWDSIICLHLHPDDLVWSDDDKFVVNVINNELEAELEWATRRTESKNHGRPIPHVDDPDAYRKCLTAMETRHLYKYLTRVFGHSVRLDDVSVLAESTTCS